MEVLRKKSITGYANEDTWDAVSFIGGNLPCLYLSAKPTYIYAGITINPLKFRITIEEIK